jgi:hypothetical protein
MADGSRQTLGSVAGEILSMYEALSSKRVLLGLRRTGNNMLGRRLDLLAGLNDGSIAGAGMAPEQAMEFQEALLDAMALQLATGSRKSPFDSMRVEQPSLLGSARNRRAKLEEGDQAQLDWHLQNLVQAGAAAKGFGQLRDLCSDSRFSGQRICDFALPLGNRGHELLECKRFRPKSSFTAGGAVPAVTKKIVTRLPSLVDQLNQTSNVVGGSPTVKHALIDISGYSDSQREVHVDGFPVVVRGFDEGEIDEIESGIISSCSGLDKLTLCWRQSVWITGKIRASIQRTRSSLIGGDVTGSLNYEGWTVEGYPREENEYGEFRISSRVKSLDSIVVSYMNLSDPKSFWKVGEIETL